MYKRQGQEPEHHHHADGSKHAGSIVEPHLARWYAIKLFERDEKVQQELNLPKGIQDAMKSGVLAGFPCVDFKVNLVFGSYHEVDSSEQAFYVAGSMAIKDAMHKAGPVLLEPIMDVEVVTPEEYLGDVMGDLNGRRGRVQSMEARAGGAQSVRAQVPLASMFGYATDLRSRTQGRATFTMQFDHYERVPAALAEEIQKAKS